jgi:hypothetical protein
MLKPYRTVLATAGARPFVRLGLLARLPMAMTMTSLGEVLLLRSTTGSYAVAGAVSAVGQLGNAVPGPTIGRQIDPRGQPFWPSSTRRTGRCSSRASSSGRR